ncbi:MAG: guanylate kinase [Opitutales bacterium]|nr:guanylate kinase [Opitutales bacterium]
MDGRGAIIVISGPAGSGKNTVAERLMAEFPNVRRVITSTSRPPRGKEVDGVDYHFLSPEQFARGVERGEFYEYAEVHGRYYGTSKSAVLGGLSRGDDMLLIIDVQGAESWRKIAAENPEISGRLTTVFVAPDSVDELRKRLAGRATETQEEIETRMKTAESEMRQAEKFDRRIVSKSRDDDYAALREIYLGIKSAK